MDTGGAGKVQIGEEIGEGRQSPGGNRLGEKGFEDCNRTAADWGLDDAQSSHPEIFPSASQIPQSSRLPAR
jgi:hypothetical protein